MNELEWAHDTLAQTFWNKTFEWKMRKREICKVNGETMKKTPKKNADRDGKTQENSERPTFRAVDVNLNIWFWVYRDKAIFVVETCWCGNKINIK